VHRLLKRLMPGHGSRPARRARDAHLRPRVEVLEDRTVPTTIMWTGQGDGISWSVGNNWDLMRAPAAGDDAVIAGAAVTHSSQSGNSPLNSLSLSNATLNLSGGSVMTSTIQGSLSKIVLQGGTIAGPSATDDVDHVGAGVTIHCTSAGGTVSGLIADGTIDVKAAGARVTIVDGMTLNGTILVGDDNGTTYGQVFFSHSPGDFPENIGGPGQIVLGGSSYNLLAIATPNTTVEFETDTVIHGKSGQILTQFASSTYLNAATINADMAGGIWTVSLGIGDMGTNQGTIKVTNGDSLSLGGTWTNNPNTDSGTLSVAGGTLTLGGTWSSSGLIDVSGGTLNLGGAFTTPTGTYSRTGGTVNLTGMLNNGGSTLALDANTGSWNFSGRINGGMITEADGAQLLPTPVYPTPPVLDGVTLDGDLDLTRTNGVAVVLVDGLTLNGTLAVGNVPGTTGGIVYSGNAETIDSSDGTGNILFGGSTNNYVMPYASLPWTVTFGPGLTIHGKNGTLTGPTTYVNQGTIAADTTGGTLTINSAAWSNSGTVQASNGGTLSASAPTNFSGGTLTGGTWKVFTNSTLRVTLPSSIVTNAATIVLDGANSNFYRDSGMSNALVGFATNSANGSFTVQNGRNFTTMSDFENDGTLIVGPGSTFNVHGNFTQSSMATLDLQLAGTFPGQYGTLAVTGTAMLDGTLLDTGTANSGDQFWMVLTYGARIGDFLPSTDFSWTFDDTNGFMNLTKQ
jgi:hypothetical protein